MSANMDVVLRSAFCSRTWSSCTRPRSP